MESYLLYTVTRVVVVASFSADATRSLEVTKVSTVPLNWLTKPAPYLSFGDDIVKAAVHNEDESAFWPEVALDCDWRRG